MAAIILALMLSDEDDWDNNNMGVTELIILIFTTSIKLIGVIISLIYLVFYG